MRRGPIVLVVVVAASAAIVVWFIQPRGEVGTPVRPARVEAAVATSLEAAPAVTDASNSGSERPDPEYVPEELEAHLAAHLSAADAGSADAAYEMFRLTSMCAPHRYPRTEADIARIAEEIRSWSGRNINKERALAKLARQRKLCDLLASRALPDHLHWLALAAERGHPEAMVGYWHFHQVDDALHPERYDPARFEAVRLNAIAYLERARDAGVADAFSTIGAGQAGLLGSTPFERDDVEGLAHLYAAGRVDPEEGARWAESGFIRTVELRVPAHALAEARDRAEELIRDCCR